MSQQRYTPEFKDEAVRQVTERGPSVQEVAARLGVSSHSLYKWVKAVRPSKDEQRADELLEVKKENLRLRAELRRVEEERDILKKAAVDSTDRRNIICSTSETGGVVNGPEGATGTVRIAESGALGTMEERAVV
jgi:transposase